MDKLRSFNIKFLLVAFFNSPFLCEAGAASSCQDLTADTLITRTTTEISTLTVADFPAELKINEAFLLFLETQLPAEKLHSLVRILQVNKRLGAHVPASLRRSISVDKKTLVIPAEDQRLPDFDTDNLQLVRAYSILKTLVDAATVLEDRPTVRLTEVELQTWALMIASYVPAEYPQTLTVKLRGFDQLVLKRLETALTSKTYRTILALLLNQGLDLGISFASLKPSNVIPLTSSQQRPSLPMRPPDATKISSIIDKIKSDRSLSKKEFIELQVLSLCLFLTSVGDDAQDYIMRPTVSHTVNVVPLQDNILKHLMSYEENKQILIRGMTFFDYIFLGIPLEMSLSQFNGEFLKLVEAQYLAEPRRLWTQQQKDVRLQQEAAAQAALATRLQSIRNDPAARVGVARNGLLPETVSLPEPPPREKVKTRGVANPTSPIPVVPTTQTATENRIETLIEMQALALHIIAEETPYVVRFQRHRDQYPHDQTFMFSEIVVKWMSENPELAIDFLEAIHRGPITYDGQSGIKMLAHTEGRPYEVKIQGTGVSWRMIVEKHDGIWYALRVIHRDRL